MEQQLTIGVATPCELPLLLRLPLLLLLPLLPLRLLERLELGHGGLKLRASRLQRLFSLHPPCAPTCAPLRPRGPVLSSPAHR